MGTGTEKFRGVKLTYEGSVGLVFTLLKNQSGISIGASGNKENIGFNYADRRALAP